MTAPVREWREIRPEEAREGDTIRLTLRDKEGYDGEATGTLCADGLVKPAYWYLSHVSVTKVERATPALPTEPGTVIDATMTDGMRRRLYLTHDTDSEPWFGTHSADHRRYFGPDDIADWTPVAPAPTDGDPL